MNEYCPTIPLKKINSLYIEYCPAKRLVILLNQIDHSDYWEEDFRSLMHELRQRDYMDLIADSCVDDFNECVPQHYRKNTWEEIIDVLNNILTTAAEDAMERAHDHAMLQNVEDYENQYSNPGGFDPYASNLPGRYY